MILNEVSDPGQACSRLRKTAQDSWRAEPGFKFMEDNGGQMLYRAVFGFEFLAVLLHEIIIEIKCFIAGVIQVHAGEDKMAEVWPVKRMIKIYGCKAVEEFVRF